MLCHRYPPDSCLFLYGWVFLEVFVIATRFMFFLMWLSISELFVFWWVGFDINGVLHRCINSNQRTSKSGNSVLYYRNQDLRQFCCFLVILRIQRAWVSQRWQGRLAAPNRCSTPGWLLVIWGLGHLRTSIVFYRFSFIFLDLHGFPSMGSYNGQSQLAAPIENFARLHAGFLSSAVFHRILSITMDF